MEKKQEHISILGLVFTLLVIACTVAAVVYGIAAHRKHLHDAKWKDYDECGIS